MSEISLNCRYRPLSRNWILVRHNCMLHVNWYVNCIIRSNSSFCLIPHSSNPATLFGKLVILHYPTFFKLLHLSSPLCYVIHPIVGPSRVTIQWIENRVKIPILRWIVNWQFTFPNESIQLDAHWHSKILVQIFESSTSLKQTVCVLALVYYEPA